MKFFKHFLPILLNVNLAYYPLQAQETIIPNLTVKNKSFAIIVDIDTYEHCKNDIENYTKQIKIN